MAVMQRPRAHHAVVTGSAVVSVAGIVVALVVYAHTKSGLALFVAICVAVGSVLSFGSVVAARAMIASATTAGHPGAERLTGRVLVRTLNRPPAPVLCQQEGGHGREERGCPPLWAG